MTVDFEPLNQAVADAFAAITFDFVPQTGIPVQGLIGDYRRQSVLVDDGESSAQTRIETLAVRLSQSGLLGVQMRIDDGVTFSGKSWRIVSVDDDGEGFAVLQLHES